MRLGLHVGYWGLGMTAEQQLEAVKAAESAGYDSVWAAEAYGSDTATVLAWIAAQTETIKIGSAILQIPGRTPAMTAMTAATLDHLSNGRMILGIGSARGPPKRADAPGDRLFGASGGRGRAGPAVRPPAAAHTRVRRDPAQGPG